MSTFIEDDPKKQKPVEFTDVIKPEHIATPDSTPVAKEFNLPSESQGAMVAASISESKEWKPFLSQINDAQIKDVKKYAPAEEFAVEVNGQLKTYTRKKIKTKDYATLEQLRGKFTTTTGADRSMLQIEIFQKAALYYLGMSQEDFDNSDFETVKKILDAQNIRTLYGIPNSS